MKIQYFLILLFLFLSSCVEDKFIILPDSSLEEDSSDEIDYSSYTFINGDYYNTSDYNLLINLFDLLSINGDASDISEYQEGLYWYWGTAYYYDRNYYRDLVVLDFNNTNINDEQLSQVLESSNLEKLQIENENDITSLPINLPSLKELYLNNLIDLESITSLPELESLDIYNCQDLIEINPSPFLTPTLTRLYFNNSSSNNIEIPSNINLPNINFLYISGYFNGTLPEALFNGEDLEVLDISNTSIEGSISDNISQLEDLVTLRLDRNNLSGAIPSSIGLLDDLQTLDLEGNQLSGSIPNELFTLPSLNFIDLSENDLSGDIPESVCTYIEDSTNSYRIIYLHGNKFCGSIPSCIVDQIGTQNCE